jgi:gentisate 1,2-dioxygenase
MSSPPNPPPGTLRAAIKDAQLHPLWEMPRTEGHQAPNKVEPAFHWKWSELGPIIDRSAAEIGMEDADRRALLLANPHLRPTVQTTTNLMAAIQVLRPGDRAIDHRHSAAAIRLIIEATGGWTSVDGVEAEMSPGDFILTPSWTWHGHANETSSRVVWLDGLDAPFVRAIDASFFEPHPPNLNLPHVARDWSGTGLVSATEGSPAPRFSPQIRYPWKSTSEALAAQAPGPDGSVKLRYVNPGTGGAVMPTLDCYVQRLSRGRRTMAQRSTANAVCFVMSGEGMSRIGTSSIAWKERDIFTIPHWSWAAHEAASPGADLFFLTDRELLRRLDLLREETSPDVPRA